MREIDEEGSLSRAALDELPQTISAYVMYGLTTEAVFCVRDYIRPCCTAHNRHSTTTMRSTAALITLLAVASCQVEDKVRYEGAQVLRVTGVSDVNKEKLVELEEQESEY